MLKFLVAAMWMAGCVSAMAWTSATSVSPVDDSKLVQISVDAEGTYTNRYGRAGRATLVAQCEQNTTLLAILFPELYMSGNGPQAVATLRVDRKPAVEVTMIAGNDHGSLALRSSDAVARLKDMVGGDTLFMRVLPVNERAIDIRFPIKGVEEALNAVRKTCGW